MFGSAPEACMFNFVPGEIMSEKGEKAKVKPRRRWFQFSLGSMLLLMTVFGVWFGLRMDRARRQAGAVAALREFGEVRYTSWFVDAANTRRFAKGSTYAPRWLRALLGDDYFERVRAVLSLRPESEFLTDAGVEHLTDLPDIEVLVIAESQMTDGGMKYLRHLHHLKELSVSSRNVTDAGLSHIRGLRKLNWLTISCSGTDAGLIHLKPLHELRYLSLDFPLSDEGILSLSCFEQLETLYVTTVEGDLSEVSRALREFTETTRVDFRDEPMPGVVQYLCDFHDIQISIDEDALHTARIRTDLPITITQSGQPLETTLKAMLSDTSLDWILTPNGILITTEEKAADRLAAVRELQKRLPKLKTVNCVVEL